MFIRVVPNILTITRICLAPIICILIYMNTNVTNIISIILTCIACATDRLDGSFARKYNICSSFGRCLDPIADKILVMSLIVMLVYLHKAWVFSGIVILFRELMISGVREFIATEKQLTIHVTKIAKIKTATQMLALLLILSANINSTTLLIGNILFSIAAILSLISGAQYIFSLRHLLLR